MIQFIEKKDIDSSPKVQRKSTACLSLEIFFLQDTSLICRNKLAQVSFLFSEGHGKETLSLVQLVDLCHFIIC